jgi:MoaA/NifB/PqqE/SkfB family radical SAM enzyme
MTEQIWKKCSTPDYNFVFNRKTGLFFRWGKDVKDDPEFSPIGAEILDVEVSTICSNGCKFCYKSNKFKGKNMSLSTFTRLFKKFPKQLTQIALGIGDVDANPDLKSIMECCRKGDVVPNITINGSRMTPYYYDMLADLCGAVAVSLYDYDTCYTAVAELAKRKMKQVNIHALMAQETLDKSRKVLADKGKDKRLDGLNAVVFLWLKPMGERNTFTQVRKKEFGELVNQALDENKRIGFDSCSSSILLHSVSKERRALLAPFIEPCESTLFSYYINVEGLGYPCSFAEGQVPSVDVLSSVDFNKDVWYNGITKKFRERVIKSKDNLNCRTCVLYSLGKK